MHSPKPLAVWPKMPRSQTPFAIFYSLVCLLGAVIAEMLGLTALSGMAAIIAQLFFLVFMGIFFATLPQGWRRPEDWAWPSRKSPMR